jgi:phage terminase large subunit
MAKEVDLPYNFIPRDYQLPFLEAMDSGFKYACLMWPRRHGKDKTAFCYLIKRMIQEVGNYGYVFPTGSLAREAAWQNIDKQGFHLLDHIPKELIRRKVDNQMYLELVNGSTLKFFGSDRQISVGTAYKGLVFSEFALQNPEAYFYLRPVLLENNGFLIIASTPRGKNHFYDLWEMAKNNNVWFTQKLTWKQTGVFKQEDIDQEKLAGMSEEMIRSEYEVDFTGLIGSYYIRYVDQMRIDHRIGKVPYDSTARVSTSWDIGIGDSTAILFFQVIGNEVHIIDCYETNGEALSHYANILDKKGYLYENHYAPHDIENRELTTGLSRKDVAANLGVRFSVLPTLKIRLEDGIEITRGTFSRIWIDESKCSKLIKALENYRKEFDEKNNVYKERPVHDQYSHLADSFRYMCMAVKNYSVNRMTPEKIQEMRRASFLEEM